MPQDSSIPGSPQEWLARAKGNLTLAKQSKVEGAFREDLCFLAQQAAEKALKAVYQSRALSFRYIHDLEELGKGLAESYMSKVFLDSASLPPGRTPTPRPWLTFQIVMLVSRKATKAASPSKSW